MSVSALHHAIQPLLEATSALIDADSELAAEHEHQITRANAAVDGFARASSQRKSSRPLQDQRVRKAT